MFSSTCSCQDSLLVAPCTIFHLPRDNLASQGEKPPLPYRIFYQPIMTIPIGYKIKPIVHVILKPNRKLI